MASTEEKLWASADELRANSGLKASEYSVPVLGLIFLRFADYKFAQVQRDLQAISSRRRSIGPADYKARGVLYVPEEARYESLLRLSEDQDVAQRINDATKAIEAHNDFLRDVLPKNYALLENRTLKELLKLLSDIPNLLDGDAFGRVYEYFLGNFAISEGQKGGEFFTPTSIVKLIVEIIEPFHGRIYDPACGSGGMFVQSARFVEAHSMRPSDELSVFGQEKTGETVRLAKMNLAVHGLSGDIREGNSYYEDLHDSIAGGGRFDFVMANPPFNVDRVDKERVKGDPRFTFGVPNVDNANYLWIQAFYSALNDAGRAGFVMASSAGDARKSEMEIRRQLIRTGAVEIIIAMTSKFFYTVPGPCTLWFLNKGKRGTSFRDKVLFIDARHIFRDVDRAHREFTSEQIAVLSGIVKMYRGETLDNVASEAVMATLGGGAYRDVPGLCKVASIEQIEDLDWSLNPGRYIDVLPTQESREDLDQRLSQLTAEFDMLSDEADELVRSVRSLLMESTAP